MRPAAADWAASGLPAMMTVLRNEGRWDTSNADFDGARVPYDKRAPTPGMRWIDYGLGGLCAEALAMVGDEVNDLADLYQRAVPPRAAVRLRRNRTLLRDRHAGRAGGDRFLSDGARSERVVSARDR